MVASMVVGAGLPDEVATDEKVCIRGRLWDFDGLGWGVGRCVVVMPRADCTFGSRHVSKLGATKCEDSGKNIRLRLPGTS